MGKRINNKNFKYLKKIEQHPKLAKKADEFITELAESIDPDEDFNNEYFIC